MIPFLYTRNWQNIINQLSANKIFKEIAVVKNEISVKEFMQKATGF